MQLELLSDFKIPSTAIPARSRLISLKPIGIGTSRAEALLSYITRLAEKHVVQPKMLIKNILVPETEIQRNFSYTSFELKDSRTVNSYTKYSHCFSSALEKLTGQKNLSHLTFLPWKDLLDQKGSKLLRDHVAWCPECLGEMDSSEDGIYYPLIWYLLGVSICTRHHMRLIDVCPRCGSYQRFVSQRPVLGYCTGCGGWLGGVPTHAELGADLKVSQRENFMTIAIEEMIATGPSASVIATQQNFIERLENYCEVLSNGNKHHFEKLLGLNKNAAQNWVFKQCRPRVDLYLELCFRLNVSPVYFLTNEAPKDLPSRIRHFPPTTKSKKLKRTEREMLAFKNSLEECLSSTNAPTVRAVSTRLGVTKGFLAYHFSELTKAISEKHKQVSADRVASILNERIERAREIVGKMLSDQRPISRRMIWAELDKHGETFAKPEIRRAVFEVIAQHQKNLIRPTGDI